jgi:hypothetical protein
MASTSMTPYSGEAESTCISIVLVRVLHCEFGILHLVVIVLSESLVEFGHVSRAYEYHIVLGVHLTLKVPIARRRSPKEAG